MRKPSACLSRRPRTQPAAFSFCCPKPRSPNWICQLPTASNSLSVSAPFRLSLRFRRAWPPTSAVPMDERTRGVVLRLYPLTETSLIVNWLTPGFGRLSTVAKGARRPKSPFGGKLDLFYVADFSFSRSRRSELHTLREVALRETHEYLRRDLRFLQQASYCVRLIELATETDTPL